MGKPQMEWNRENNSSRKAKSLFSFFLSLSLSVIVAKRVNRSHPAACTLGRAAMHGSQLIVQMGSAQSLSLSLSGENRALPLPSSPFPPPPPPTQLQLITFYFYFNF
jgi:hypothetical protein